MTTVRLTDEQIKMAVSDRGDLDTLFAFPLHREDRDMILRERTRLDRAGERLARADYLRSAGVRLGDE